MPSNYSGEPANLSKEEISDMVREKTPQLTAGQKLVGLNFNPSNDDKVGKAKQLCADLADLLYEDRKRQETSALYDELYHHTIGEILNAQMNVVKVLTLKY